MSISAIARDVQIVTGVLTSGEDYLCFGAIIVALDSRGRITVVDRRTGARLDLSAVDQDRAAFALFTTPDVHASKEPRSAFAEATADKSATPLVRLGPGGDYVQDANSLGEILGGGNPQSTIHNPQSPEAEHATGAA